LSNLTAILFLRDYTTLSAFFLIGFGMAAWFVVQSVEARARLPVGVVR